MRIGLKAAKNSLTMYSIACEYRGHSLVMPNAEIAPTLQDSEQTGKRPRPACRLVCLTLPHTAASLL